MSNSWSGFGDLDLSNVEADNFIPLGEGKHKVKVTKASVENVTNSTSKKKLVVFFSATDGSGDIKTNFNIVNPSEDAQRIGRSQLKSLLIAAGHPNPDKPGDVGSLVGLECWIIVAPGKPYKDNNGNKKVRNEVKRYLSDSDAAKYQYTPQPAAAAEPTQSGSSGSSGSSGGSGFDDDIPF